MYDTLNRTLIKKKKLKCYEIMAVPVITHGRENWVLGRADRRKTETAEIQFLLPVSQPLTVVCHDTSQP